MNYRNIDCVSHRSDLFSLKLRALGTCNQDYVGMTYDTDADRVDWFMTNYEMKIPDLTGISETIRELKETRNQYREKTTCITQEESNAFANAG